jgi:preprotein translocase subunit SecG
MMTVLSWALLVILLLSSAILILMVLLHKGKGGGLSSMFGGGMSSVASGSTVAEKNLTRITIGVGIIWFACIIAFGLLMRAVA